MKKYKLLVNLPDGAMVNDIYSDNGYGSYVNERMAAFKSPIIEHNSYFSWQVENKDFFELVTERIEVKVRYHIYGGELVIYTGKIISEEYFPAIKQAIESVLTDTVVMDKPFVWTDKLVAECFKYTLAEYQKSTEWSGNDAAELYHIDNFKQSKQSPTNLQESKEQTWWQKLGVKFDGKWYTHPKTNTYDNLDQIMEEIRCIPYTTVKDKQEWEIVDMKHYEDNSIHPYIEKTCFNPSHPPCTIWSVRRLSDNTVFSIGGRVFINGYMNTINKFELEFGDKMTVYFIGLNIQYEISQLPTPTEPLPTDTNVTTNNDDVACLSLNDLVDAVSYKYSHKDYFKTTGMYNDFKNKLKEKLKSTNTDTNNDTGKGMPRHWWK